MNVYFRHNRSGQALTEGVIGLSLMCMVFTLVGIFYFMTVNKLSCLEAARHTAWVRGRGGMLPVIGPFHKFMLEIKFFYQPELAKVKSKSALFNRELVSDPFQWVRDHAEYGTGAAAYGKLFRCPSGRLIENWACLFR